MSFHTQKTKNNSRSSQVVFLSFLLVASSVSFFWHALSPRLQSLSSHFELLYLYLYFLLTCLFLLSLPLSLSSYLPNLHLYHTSYLPMYSLCARKSFLSVLFSSSLCFNLSKGLQIFFIYSILALLIYSTQWFYLFSLFYPAILSFFLSIYHLFASHLFIYHLHTLRNHHVYVYLCFIPSLIFTLQQTLSLSSDSLSFT